MISNHCVQERVILPLGDILTGQSVSKYLRFLQKSRRKSTGFRTNGCGC